MIFCQPIHFTIALFVLSCYLNFASGSIVAQTYVSHSQVSYDSIENTKIIEFSCISNLSDSVVQEISSLFIRFIGIEEINFCRNSKKLSFACIPLIQPKDLEPLFAMLEITVAEPGKNVEEIRNKIVK